jgi:hypothetical protein
VVRRRKIVDVDLAGRVAVVLIVPRIAFGDELGEVANNLTWHLIPE